MWRARHSFAVVPGLALVAVVVNACVSSTLCTLEGTHVWSIEFRAVDATSGEPICDATVAFHAPCGWSFDDPDGGRVDDCTYLVCVDDDHNAFTVSRSGYATRTITVTSRATPS